MMGALLAIFMGCQSEAQKQKRTIIDKDVNVENILDTIWTLQEVNDRNASIKQKSENKRELIVFIQATPDELEEEYYWVKVAEDHGTAFYSHFDFYVYPNWDIHYYDRVKDLELSLEDWRKK